MQAKAGPVLIHGCRRDCVTMCVDMCTMPLTWFIVSLITDWSACELCHLQVGGFNCTHPVADTNR